MSHLPWLKVNPPCLGRGKLSPRDRAANIWCSEGGQRDGSPVDITQHGQAAGLTPSGGAQKLPGGSTTAAGGAPGVGV